MKKSTAFVFSLLFLTTALISNAQQTLPFSTKDYIFPDENIMISPATNHESIFIVFSENALDASIMEFEALHPELIHNPNHSFPWHNYKLYTLEQSHRNTAEIAEAYLAKLRGNPAISSAYPAFIRNGDTAFLDKQFLLNLRKEDASREKVIKLIKPFKGTVTEELDMIRSTTFAISVPAYVNIFTACSELHKLPEVLYAQPNFYFSGTVGFIPNDPMFSDQWFLNQSSDCDIDAVEAWDITTGSASIAVAVIDGDGFDLGHAEMSGKYLSPYNAVDDNNNPTAIESEENHGTPCAGLIGALTNNSVGVASVGYNVMVVPIKIGFDFSGGSFSTSVIILERACEHVMTAPYSIVAVSNSYILGSWANITSVRDAYSHMRTDSRGGLGTVVLASTGNDNAVNLEGFPFHFAHVVGVGSTDRYDSRSSFSNYGDSTDIASPGTDTWTIDRSGAQGYSLNDYCEFNGTSASCPIAAGIIGLIGSVHPEYTELQLRTQLYNSCDKVGGYSYANNANYPFGTWSIQLGYGRVNAHQAVLGGGSLLNPPTNLAADVSGNNVHLSWTAPGGGEEWISYHDGTFETSLASTNGGSGIAQLFTLPAYPVALNEIRFYTSDYNNWGQAMSIYILSGDGNNVLGGPYQTNGVNNNWINIVTSVTITQSTFMIATYNDIPDGPYVGCDDSFFNETLYFGNHTSGFTELSQLGDYEYVGSHEAKVLYKDKDGVLITEWISPVNQPEAGNTPDVHHENESLFAAYPEDMLGLLGFNIYRDGTKLNSSPWNNITYSDAGLAAGTYNYTVTAVYDEGESSAAGPVQATVSGSGLEAPTNLNGSNINQQVSLWWIGPGGGSQEELIYDNNESGSGYTYPGFTMATHMSPSGSCQILTLKYLTSIEAGDNTFYARVFNWDGSQPGNTILYENDLTAIEGWLEVDVSMDNLFVSGDFVVGFGSINEQTYLAFDANLNNGRSWDREDATSSWSSWNEAYLIRAVVQYGDGTVSEIGLKPGIPELPATSNKSIAHLLHGESYSFNPADPIENQSMSLRGFSGYNLYRESIKINTVLISSNNASDVLPTFGSWNYNVTAVYDEGESGFSNTLTINYNLGLDEFESINIMVYPNPASDKLYISSDFKINKISLHTMDGRIIMKDEPGSKEYCTDVDRLDPGLYIVSIDTDNGHAAVKIIVD